MASVQSPLVGLEMSPETATYVGLLERQVAAYAVQEAKFRALLELITGDSWETTKLDIDGKMLMGVAVDALVRRTGLTVAQATKLVTERWNTVNQVTTVPVPQSTTIEDIASQMPQPKIEDIVLPPVPGLNMRDRVADWQRRQKEAVSTLSEPETPEDVAMDTVSGQSPATPAEMPVEETP